MAIENIIQIFPFVAGADLSATDYRFVKVNSTAQEVEDAGAGELAIGIRRNSPEEGEGVEVVSVGQIAKLTAGSGGWSAGNYIKSDSDGAGVVASADKEIVNAIALTDCAAGAVGSVLVTIFTISAG